MFDLFQCYTPRDYVNNSKEKYTVPSINPVVAPSTQQKEFFRVGRTDDGMTTLTLLSDNNGSSTTLTMTQTVCEQMIRMLRATYDVEFKETDGQST
jgi:hypothetical protein